jgi:predicted lipoprotein with Yx(FWY)xxD motif
MQSRWLAAAGLAVTALTAAACGNSSPSGSGGSAKPAASHTGMPSHAAGTVLKAGKVGGAKLLTNGKGFTLYWFAPDTSTKSNCNGSCAHYWPPVTGPATAGPGVKGTLGTIKRSDGSVQATYNGHPLYTYISDTAPGEAKGNGLNLSGGVWHDITLSGKSTSGSGGGSSGGGSGSGY